MAPHVVTASSSESTSPTPATQQSTTPPSSRPHDQISEMPPLNNHSSSSGVQDPAPDSHQHAGPSTPKPTGSGQTRRRGPKTHPKVLGPLTSQSQSQSSRLLGLPLEVRRIIWSYALTASDGKLHFISASECFSRADIAVGLTLTCHQLALETAHLHLSVNTLCFDGTMAFMCWQRRHSRLEGAQGWRIRLKGVELVRREPRQRNRNDPAA